MKLIVLGVCGKLMAGVACLAAQKGYRVEGYDRQFSPPMSEMLVHENIHTHIGYPDALVLDDHTMVVVGNGLRRTDPVIQFLVKERVKLYSAPEWLMTYVLRDRHVIAITGTHGKTTITSMVAWVLLQGGMDPGYLIGGVCSQLGGCAALGSGKYFVIEADEYDTAFFDKRPKFLHYWPQTLVISHIEYDHADIFEDMKSLVKQYKYLLRLLPNDGCVISTGVPCAIVDQIQAFSLGHKRYGITKNKQCDSSLSLLDNVSLAVGGEFNRLNALAAWLVAQRVGLGAEVVCEALAAFKGVARRQTLMYQGQVCAYDDFAHHPTALANIFEMFKIKGEVVLVYNMRTYTQRQGHMDEAVIEVLRSAKYGCILLPEKHQLNIEAYQTAGIGVYADEQDLVVSVISRLEAKDQLVVMCDIYLARLWQLMLAKLGEKFGSSQLQVLA